MSILIEVLLKECFPEAHWLTQKSLFLAHIESTMGLLIGGHRVLETRGLAGTLSFLMLGGQGHPSKSQEQKEGGTGRCADAWHYGEAGKGSELCALEEVEKSQLSD